MKKELDGDVRQTGVNTIVVQLVQCIQSTTKCKRKKRAFQEAFNSEDLEPWNEHGLVVDNESLDKRKEFPKQAR